MGLAFGEEMRRGRGGLGRCMGSSEMMLVWTLTKKKIRETAWLMDIFWTEYVQT